MPWYRSGLHRGSSSALGDTAENVLEERKAALAVPDNNSLPEPYVREVGRSPVGMESPENN